MTATQHPDPAAATLAAVASLSERCLLRTQTALGALLGSAVRFTTARIERVSPGALASAVAGESLVGLRFGVQGDAPAVLLVVFPMSTVQSMLAALGMRRPREALLSAIDRSALGELGNVFAGSLLTELGDATRQRLLPSPPTLLFEDLVGVVAELVAGLERRGSGSVVQGIFEDRPRGIAGRFFVLPGPDASREGFEG